MAYLLVAGNGNVCGFKMGTVDAVPMVLLEVLLTARALHCRQWDALVRSVGSVMQLCTCDHWMVESLQQGLLLAPAVAVAVWKNIWGTPVLLHFALVGGNASHPLQGVFNARGLDGPFGLSNQLRETFAMRGFEWVSLAVVVNGENMHWLGCNGSALLLVNPCLLKALQASLLRWTALPSLHSEWD